MAKKALLVGINKYPAPNVLRGCINDVNAMRDLLVQKFGFGTDGIRMIQDGEATLANMEAGLAWLAEPGKYSTGGDVRVFHYSGHGSQVADKNGDEPDGADECVVPVDFETKGMLVDDKLAVLYDKVPQDSVLTMILDSCHSGSSQKDLSRDDVLYRFIPLTAAEEVAVERAHDKYVADREAFVRATVRDLVNKGNVSSDEFEKLYAATRAKFDGARSRYGDVNNRERNILLAGCRDNQTSADAHIAGDYHGAFTYYLIDAIMRLGVQKSHRDILAEAGKNLRTAGYQQIPQLEGRSAAKNLPLFSPLP
jgi:hypothetical protein